MKSLEISAIVATSVFLAGPVCAAIRAVAGKKHVPLTETQEMAQAAAEGWVHRILVAFDIFWNVAVWRGQEDETISTHSWRALHEGKAWGKAMNWWLNLFQPDHGWGAACGDLQRAENRVRALQVALSEWKS